MNRNHQRYTTVAPLYDLLAAEPVYRPARRMAIQRLGLRPGDRVLDLGCGTGLNFSLLAEAVGPRGRVVGVDASPQMLAEARCRATRSGWENVVLLQADATTVTASELEGALSGPGGQPGAADAVLSTYALSLMPRWPDAVDTALAVARPGARFAVVDMRIPTGRARWLAPLARLACALGGSDPTAHPWTAVEDACPDVVGAQRVGGHVQVRVGTLRPPGRS